MSAEIVKNDPAFALQRRPENAVAEYIPFGSSEKIKLTVKIVQELIATPTKSGKTCSERDAMRFMMLCRSRALNPFEGDCFLLGYDTQDGPAFSLITAHQAFLKRAEPHPEFDGMESGVIISPALACPMCRAEGGREVNGAWVVCSACKGIGQTDEIEGDIVPPEHSLIGGWAKVHFKNRKVAMKKRLSLKTFSTGRSRWGVDPAGMIVKCFDEETEILTSRGFEKFATAEGSILQVTSEGLTPTDAIPFAQDYNWKMVHWASRNGNFCVTPNHDLPLSLNGGPREKLEASVLLNQKQRDEYVMPLVIDGSRSDFPISDKGIQLAAAYIADGSDNSRSSGFSIAVSRPHKVSFLSALGGFVSKRIRDCSGDEADAGTRIIVTRANKTIFYYSKNSEVEWIVGRKKVINADHLLSLSKRQARLFVDALLRFDGSKPESCTLGRFYASRSEHIAAFEIACTVAGLSVSNRSTRTSDIGRPSYSVTVTSRKSIRLSRSMIREKLNDGGKIWCVKVPSGTIIVRRHGFATVSHNCAEADALRSSFPTKLGGLYLQEEQPEMKVARVETPTDLESSVQKLIASEPTEEPRDRVSTTTTVEEKPKREQKAKDTNKPAPPRGNARDALLARMVLEQVTESEVIEILVRKNKTTGASSLLEIPDDVIAWALEMADVIFGQIRIDRKNNTQPN